MQRRLRSHGILNWWLAGGTIDPSLVVGAWQSVKRPNFASTLVNLNNPGTNNLTSPVNPDWNQQNGWQGKNTGGYFNTGINLNQNHTVVIKFTRVNPGDAVFGVVDGANGVYLLPSDGANTHSCRWDAQTNSHAPRLDRNIVSLCGRTMYLESNLHFTFNTATFSLSRPVYIMARNNGGTADLFYQGNVHFFAIYNTPLTQTQVTYLNAAMQSINPL